MKDAKLKLSFMDALKRVRKPTAKPSRVFKDAKAYNRKRKDWKEEG